MIELRLLVVCLAFLRLAYGEDWARARLLNSNSCAGTKNEPRTKGRLAFSLHWWSWTLILGSHYCTLLFQPLRMRQQPAQTPLLAHHGAAKGIGGPTHPESGGFVVRVKGGTEGHGRPLEPQTAPPQSNGWEQRKMREEDMPASTQSMCKDISGFSLQTPEHISRLNGTEKAGGLPSEGLILPFCALCDTHVEDQIDVAHQKRLRDHLATMRTDLHSGYEMTSSGVQIPARPYKRARALKSVLWERLQSGLPVDEQSLHEAAGWGHVGV
ncbi:hypothetical protein ABBQ32_007075 [Trebouxia sp. C0010 RCD-2024]